MQAREADQGALDYSTLVVPGATWDDLDALEFERLRRFVRENEGRSDAALLRLPDLELARALGFVEGSTWAEAIRVGALLLFGREAALRARLPAHEVAFQVLERNTVRVNDFFRWPLLRVMDELLARFRARIEEDEILFGFQRIGLPEVSPVALREALANALVHRDYTRLGAVHVQWRDERVDILSPGGFPLGVNAGNLLATGPRPRNPALADAFKRVGLVERTARGVELMFEAQIRSGRPRPDYGRSDREGVSVSFPRGPARPEFVRWLLSEERQRGAFTFLDLLAVDAAARAGKLTVEQAAEVIQLPTSAAGEVLDSLVHRGCLRRNGNGARGVYRPASGLPVEAAGGIQEISGDRRASLEQAILDVAQGGSPITRRQVAAGLGISLDQAKRLLERLVTTGALQRVGRGRSVTYIRALE
jgi:ATP-dependent DNA helicase RecG